MQRNHPAHGGSGSSAAEAVSRFDVIIDRRNSDSIKYAPSQNSGKPENLLPLWVADMDFRAPEPVIEALHTRAEHGIFGYGSPGEDYFAALAGWFRTHFSFEPDRRWIVQTPGVVFALSAAIQAFTERGDAVLINRPVYYPFSNLIDGLGRRLINSPLVFDGSGYRIDFRDLEEKIVQNNVRLYLLCSPHNPVGRVWTKDELTQIGDICLKHNVLLVSDEIHRDFVWSDHPHTIFASLGEKYRDFCVVCTSPSKTFNLAGLCASNIIIPNRELRKRFRKCVFDTGVTDINVMAIAGCRAAYEHGLPWLTEARDYIRKNIGFTDAYLKQHAPSVRLIRPEGTYLLWLDMTQLGLSEEELELLITEKAGLWLDGGGMFGPEGAGFQRLNAACPRLILEEALRRLCDAVNDRACRPR